MRWARTGIVHYRCLLLCMYVSQAWEKLMQPLSNEPAPGVAGRVNSRARGQSSDKCQRWHITSRTAKIPSARYVGQDVVVRGQKPLTSQQLLRGGSLRSCSLTTSMLKVRATAPTFSDAAESEGESQTMGLVRVWAVVQQAKHASQG